MSRESFLAFRKRVNSEPALNAEFTAVWRKHGDLVALARRHGFEFDANEFRQRAEEPLEGELSLAELELVAGGSDTPPTSQCPSGFTCTDVKH
jgi:predicted ribosomally synthesized peptide with nif11-like leader